MAFDSDYGGFGSSGSGGGGGSVSSVFARTGAVTAQSGDYASFYLKLDGSNNMTASVPFTAGDKGLSWASGSSFNDNSGNTTLLSGAVGFGVTAISGTKLTVKGLGATTGQILFAEDSASLERFRLYEDGLTGIRGQVLIRKGGAIDRSQFSTEEFMVDSNVGTSAKIVRIYNRASSMETFNVDGLNMFGFNGSPIANTAYTFYPSAVNNTSVFRIQGQTLTDGNVFESQTQTSAASWNKTNFIYGTATAFAAIVYGARVTGFGARLITNSSVGLDVITENLTDYNQVMGRIAYSGGSLTASNTNPQLYIARQATALNGFDMTGAMIELDQGSSMVTTGDYLKCWDRTNVKFSVAYDGTVNLADTKGLLWIGGSTITETGQQLKINSIDFLQILNGVGSGSDITIQADGSFNIIATTADGNITCNDLLINNTGLSFFSASAVAQQGPIADATGGAIIDAEARAAINALLAANRNYNLIST